MKTLIVRDPAFEYIHSLCLKLQQENNWSEARMANELGYDPSQYYCICHKRQDITLHSARIITSTLHNEFEVEIDLNPFFLNPIYRL